MLVVGESAGKHISDFSQQFQYEFVQLLSRRYSTNRVKANNVYQEYIQDRNHLHMNATRWVTLSEFIKHLGREGIVRVEDTEKGFFISWIDNSPKALAKAQSSQAREKATTSDEQRERNLIAEQIARATEASEPSTSTAPPPEAALLQREEGAAPLKLSFGAPKKSASPPASSSSGTTPAPSSSSTPAVVPTAPLKMNALKMGMKPANPLKGNVFKSSSKASVSNPLVGGVKRPREDDGMSAAQRLILEEQERKKRRMERAAAA